jgi:phenylacetate-CoA ligase
VKFGEVAYRRSPIPVQTLLLNLKAVELYLERYGPKFRRLFDQFVERQWRPMAEQAAYQDEQLRRLIQHAYESVPYYRDVMNERGLTPSDFKGTGDLPKLPVLTKDDVRRHHHRLMSTKYPKLLLRHGHTSGTTGSPLDFHYDINTCVIHHVADWRYKLGAGLTYGQPYASVLGRVIVPISQDRPPFWRKNYINNQLFMSSFHLKRENLPYYFDKLSAANVQTIEAYPSTAYLLARYLLDTGQHFPLKSVLTSSETLFDDQRAAIESAFRCKVFDAYGMAERVVFATECDQHSGLHLNTDYGYVEYLDSQDRAASPGALAKVVATGLHNFAMPLIRYTTGDASALKSGTCRCGRGFPLVESVTTKWESIVTLPDGRLISPSVLTHPFKPMKNVRESQLIQERIDELIVKIVRREGYSDRDDAALIAGFHERLGDQIKIRIVHVDSIPRTNNAKFRWVISQIPPSFAGTAAERVG